MFQKSFAVLAVAVAAIYAQPQDGSTCGCQPQPTIIQLSCGNGNSGGLHPPPPHHAPPHHFSTSHYGKPMEYTTAPSYVEETTQHRWNLKDDPDRQLCAVDDRGYLWDTLIPGGLPENYHIDPETLIAYVPQGYYDPSPYWDGFPETLGFPMPDKGTPQYNLLLCYPYKGNVGRLEEAWR